MGTVHLTESEGRSFEKALHLDKSERITVAAIAAAPGPDDVTGRFDPPPAPRPPLPKREPRADPSATGRPPKPHYGSARLVSDASRLLLRGVFYGIVIGWVLCKIWEASGGSPIP